MIDQTSACLNTNTSIQVMQGGENDPGVNQPSIGDMIAKTETSVRSDSIEEMQALLQTAKDTQPNHGSGTYGGSFVHSGG